jgi:hypothetical protein
MSAANATATRVILTGTSDWEEWIEVIKSTAITGDIWEYVNPNVAVPPVLKAPIRPTPALIRNAGASQSESTQPLGSGSQSESTQTLGSGSQPVNSATAAYANLTDEEKQYLLYLQREFEHDRKKYEEKVKAMKDLRVRIQESIKREYLPYTYKCDAAHQMLVRLQDRFAPTDRAKK